jgi:hypothetical protein
MRRAERPLSQEPAKLLLATGHSDPVSLAIGDRKVHEMKNWMLGAVVLAMGATPALAQYAADSYEASPASDGSDSSEGAESPPDSSAGTGMGTEASGAYDYERPLAASVAPPVEEASEEEGGQEEEESGGWWENFRVAGFADAYYMADWNRPSSPTAASDVGHRAFDSAAGFGLAFAGLDIRYNGEHAGATLDLRFGDGAARLLTGAASSPNPAVLQMLKQAFLTWNPTDSLSLDFGQFDTIYGAEVADSWRNINYTRGALYYLMQPFYHQGLRAGYQVNDTLKLTAMLVNGTNNVVDNNFSPHLGLQAGLSLGDASLVIGYYGGAGSSGFGSKADVTDNGDWEHFLDVVFGLSSGPLSIVANADLYISGPDSGEGPSIYWGASLAASIAASDMFSVGLRQEFLHDPDAYIGNGQDFLLTTTLTLDLKPLDNLIIRLDNRFEYADADIFTNSDGPEQSGTWFATTLGVVVTSDP